MLNIKHCNSKVYRNNTKKWKRQRVTRGFADIDIWNLDLYLLELLPAMIDHLAKTSDHWPDDKFSEFKDWQNYLFNISNKFREAYNTFCKICPAEEKENNREKAQSLIKEAFNDMGEVFFSLWD